MMHDLHDDQLPSGWSESNAAQEVAEEARLSRSTAQRYLEQLARDSRLRLSRR